MTLSEALAVLDKFEYANYSFGGEFVKRYPTEIDYLEAMDTIKTHLAKKEDSYA